MMAAKETKLKVVNINRVESYDELDKLVCAIIEEENALGRFVAMPITIVGKASAIGVAINQAKSKTDYLIGSTPTMPKYVQIDSDIEFNVSYRIAYDTDTMMSVDAITIVLVEI